MNIMDENSEIGRHLKKAWETQEVEQPEKDSFMVCRKCCNKNFTRMLLNDV
jgi:hypothetical protein